MILDDVRRDRQESQIGLTADFSFYSKKPKGKSSPWQSDLWKDRSLDHMKCSSVEFM